MYSFLGVLLQKKYMKFLITGATGLVGTALTEFLLRSGHSIHILSTRKNHSPNHENVRSFYWNPTESYVDAKAFEGIEVVIHLAGASISQRWTPKAKREILDSRVLSTRLLYESIKNLKSIKHFVSASAIGLYPSHLSKTYIEEESQKAQSFTGEVVQKWEAEAASFRSLPIKVSIVRIGLVMSSKGGALIPLAMPTRWGMGVWFGNGQQWQSWIHIHDLVRAIDFVVQNKIEGVFNATAPEPVLQRTLVKAIAKKLGAPQWLPGIPKLPIRLAMGSMSEVLFESLRVAPAALTYHGFGFSYPDIEGCLDNLL